MTATGTVLTTVTRQDAPVSLTFHYHATANAMHGLAVAFLSVCLSVRPFITLNNLLRNSYTI